MKFFIAVLVADSGRSAAQSAVSTAAQEAIMIF